LVLVLNVLVLLIKLSDLLGQVVHVLLTEAVVDTLAVLQVVLSPLVQGGLACKGWNHLLTRAIRVPGIGSALLLQDLTPSCPVPVSGETARVLALWPSSACTP